MPHHRNIAEMLRKYNLACHVQYQDACLVDQKKKKACVYVQLTVSCQFSSHVVAWCEGGECTSSRIKLPTEANPLPPVPPDSLFLPSAWPGTFMIHFNLSLGMLQKLTSHLSCYTLPVKSSVTTGNFLQGIPNRMISKLVLLYSVLACVVFFPPPQLQQHSSRLNFVF